MSRIKFNGNPSPKNSLFLKRPFLQNGRSRRSRSVESSVSFYVSFSSQHCDSERNGETVKSSRELMKMVLRESKSTRISLRIHTRAQRESVERKQLCRIYCSRVRENASGVTEALQAAVSADIGEIARHLRATDGSRQRRRQRRGTINRDMQTPRKNNRG